MWTPDRRTDGGVDAPGGTMNGHSHVDGWTVHAMGAWTRRYFPIAYTVLNIPLHGQPDGPYVAIIYDGP